MTDDVRKLLGGYATGTLSPNEKQVLFEAALQDNELFAALSDEHALKNLLDDSAIRAQLLRATEEPRFSVTAALREWFERPKSKVLVTLGAILLMAIGFQEVRHVRPQPTQIAEVRESEGHKNLALGTPADSSPPAAKEVAKPAPPKPQPKLEKREANKPAAPPEQYAQVPPQPEALMSGRQMQLADAAPPVKQAEIAPSLPVRYELLLQSANGEFQPVPNNHEFQTGDVMRVRVTSSRAGAVAISAAGRTTVSSPVRANETTTLPADGGIRVTPASDKLVLGFAVLGADLTSASRSFRAANEAKAAPASNSSLTIEIPLRQRKQ
ncbi:MAG TPA: hypothetical protein VEX68_14990 [Bryobacteraceae bacterium]|nr:hypothetical protein [Bryobacteraceae bacterium]